MMNPEMEVEILLVEDNPYDAEMTLRALKKYNICNHLIHVADGEAALDFIFARGQFSDRLERHKPKIILLDLKLPKIDGLEVIKALKNDPRAKTIPVVVLTSSREETDLIQSYQLGVNSYIVKPVEFEKFAAAIRDIGSYWLILNQAPAK